MAQIKKLKLNGNTIYPVTHPKAVIDPSSGRSIASAATQSADGLMSAADKKKLDDINTAQYVTLTDVQTITGRKDFSDGIIASGSSAFDNIQINGDIDIQNDAYITFEEGFHISTAFGNIEPPAGSGVLALKSDIPTNYLTPDTPEKLSAALNNLTEGNSEARPTDYIICQWADGNITGNYTYTKRPLRLFVNALAESGELLRFKSSSNGNTIATTNLNSLTAVNSIAVGTNESGCIYLGERGGKTFGIYRDGTDTHVSGDDILHLHASDIQLHGALVQDSDIKLKDNIKTISSSDSSAIEQICAKSYTFKRDKTNKIHYGFIAQEVEKYFPELVLSSYDRDKSETVKSLDYTGLLVLKTAYLEEKNALLKEELQSLDNRVKKLEALVSKLSQPQTEV